MKAEKIQKEMRRTAEDSDILSYEEYLHEVQTSFAASPDEYEHGEVMGTLSLMQGKWNNHVLFTLCRHGTMRFGELRKWLPRVTGTALTNTLRELEQYGLVHREQFNEIPPHVEYSLTEKGQALMPVYYEIYKWGRKYLTS